MPCLVVPVHVTSYQNAKRTHVSINVSIIIAAVCNRQHYVHNQLGPAWTFRANNRGAGRHGFHRNVTPCLRGGWEEEYIRGCKRGGQIGASLVPQDDCVAQLFSHFRKCRTCYFFYLGGWRLFCCYKCSAVYSSLYKWQGLHHRHQHRHHQRYGHGSGVVVSYYCY